MNSKNNFFCGFAIVVFCAFRAFNLFDYCYVYDLPIGIQGLAKTNVNLIYINTKQTR